MIGSFDQLKDGSAVFDTCNALQHGGAFQAVARVMLAGSTVFHKCTSGTKLLMPPGRASQNCQKVWQKLLCSGCFWLLLVC